jgi:hypothetical protein
VAPDRRVLEALEMTAKTKNWMLGVAGCVSGSVLCFAMIAWLGHFQATAQTARTAEQTAEIQERLVGIVDSLTKIHEHEDAAKVKVAELCNAGKLDDCSDCAEAGVSLERCTE